MIDNNLRDAHQRRTALTRRELQCLELLAQGESGKRIAHRLGISEKTAETYVANARRKLGGRNAVHVVAIAIVRGLLAPGGLMASQED